MHSLFSSFCKRCHNPLSLKRGIYVNVGLKRHFTSYTYDNMNDSNSKQSTSESSSSSSSTSSTSSTHRGYEEGPTLPCFLSHFDAIESFSEWSKQQWFASRQFRKNPKKYIHCINSYLVPYWHVQASARSKYHCAAKPDGNRVIKGELSCLYSSNIPQMQIIANTNVLNDEERKFLKIPLGETQFQRMQHKTTDILPVNVTVSEWSCFVFVFCFLFCLFGFFVQGYTLLHCTLYTMGKTK